MNQENDFKSFSLKGTMVLGWRKFMPPLRYQESLINEARIVYVVKGRSSLVCANKVLELKAGDTLLMKADNFVNEWHEQTLNQAVEFIGFQLSSQTLQHLYSSVPDHFSAKKYPPKSSAHALPKNELLANFMLSLQTYMQHPELFSEALISLKLKELIELLVLVDDDGEIHKMLASLFSTKEYKLQEVVQTHLYTPINLDELAFLCGLSLSTFNRRFQQLYGTSPNKYITSRRLERAQALIINTQDSLTHIALECGFDDLSYFSRLFKRHYQCSPSDLRK